MPVDQSCDDQWRLYCVGKNAGATQLCVICSCWGFGPDIAAVLAAFPDLIERRHAADYDTLIRYRAFNAISVIQTSRATIAALRNAPLDDSKAFLFLLLFPPKR